MRSLLILSLILSVFSAQAYQDTASYKKSIDEKIEKMKKKKSSWTSEEKQMMQDASDNLAKALPNPGIQVGEKAPSFSLKNSQGENITLEGALAKGPVVLVFYRGAWCPYCNMQLRSLKENLPEFEKYNAQLVTITPQTPDKSEAQFKKEGYPFEVLSDLDYQVMKDYKLYFEVPKALVELYKKHGLDLEDFNGEGRTALPVPGTFVIDTKGIVRAMTAQTDYKVRMESADIIKALSEL
ncbi:peroxiredoxin-like family protein [Colwellia sp. RE-S-Sl-9]